MDISVQSEVIGNDNDFSEYGVFGYGNIPNSIEEALVELDNQFKAENFKEALQEYIGLLPSNIWQPYEDGSGIREGWYQAYYQGIPIEDLTIKFDFRQDGSIEDFRVRNAHLSTIYLDIEQSLENIQNPTQDDALINADIIDSSYFPLYEINVNVSDGSASLRQPLIVNAAESEKIIQENNNKLSELNNKNLNKTINNNLIAVGLGIGLLYLISRK